MSGRGNAFLHLLQIFYSYVTIYRKESSIIFSGGLVTMPDKTPSSSILKDIKTKPHTSPGQKRQRVIAIVVMVIIAAGGVTAYMLLIPRENLYVLKSYDSATVATGSMVRKIQTSGSVYIPLQVTVTAPDTGDGGYVQELLVREGDRVEQNQVLAVLSVPSLEEQLRDLLVEHEDALRSYEQYVQQNRFSEARAERELARMDMEIEEAKEEVSKQQQLAAINAARQSDYNRAVKSLESLIVSYEEKHIQLEETKIINRLNEESRLSSLDRYAKSISRIESSIEAAVIRSPISGEILSMENRLTVPGSTISKNQNLFTVADRTSAIVELELPEQHAGLLNPGQTVSLSVGGKPLYGTIDTIGRVAVMAGDGLTATVKVTVIPQEGSDLIPGSTAVSEIVIGSLDNILLLPRGPYLTTGGQRFVYIIEGDRAIKTAVTFGELQTDQVQVLRGLSEGDRVIISGYQNYIEHTTIILQGADT